MTHHMVVTCRVPSTTLGALALPLTSSWGVLSLLLVDSRSAHIVALLQLSSGEAMSRNRNVFKFNPLKLRVHTQKMVRLSGSEFVQRILIPIA